MKFKFSMYNHKIELEDKVYLYNALSGGFCKLNEDMSVLFRDIDVCKDSHILENLDSDFINGLKKGAMIVDEIIDEKKLIKSLHNTSRFGNTNSLGLTLVPTTACNFRCTYCFEKEEGYPTDTMSDEVISEIVKLVDNKVDKDGNLSISWYGGEPLVAFNKIQSIQKKLNKLAEDKEFTINTSMVTNGYLLTKEISDELVNMGVSFVQVTLDGHKDIHDKRRFLVNNKGTYDKIIDNILSINKDLRVSIRVNIDKDNIQFMDEFFDDLESKGIKEMENVSIYFAVVRGLNETSKCISNTCYNIESFSEEEIKLNTIGYERGFNVGFNIKPIITNCAALSPNSFLIEPDGSMQKCWSDVGKEDRRIGHLLKSDYDMVRAQANQCEWYSWDKYEDKECSECSILPLCMGGCPYYTITEKDSGYRCIGLKYNLKDTLKFIAYNHLKAT